ncbi:MAG: hypothetical protein U0P46_02800 [Holophagaceae bacterium]
MIHRDLEFLLDSKEPLEDFCSNGGVWDLYLASYNNNDRVRTVFTNIPAKNKVWIVQPEYGYTQAELASIGEYYTLANSKESDWVINTFEHILIKYPYAKKICIDITGLMRPHLLFILLYLKYKGFNEFDMLYTEPIRYQRKDETKFTLADVSEVRQVEGFAGSHDTNMSNDVLIVGVGYDHNLVSRVILEKSSARLVQLHSLPSLSADMYQESILRLDRVSTRAKPLDDQIFFSSANDPYATMAALASAFKELHTQRPITNLYLSPLATKPQALGFGLYYLLHKPMEACSIIFPFSDSYDKETGKGVGRSWVYPIYLM